jgi:aldehyde:ferredoxin oxidoreductase
MTGGYAGKILRVNLTQKWVSTIPTAQYEEYGGGHGIGSALFFDLVGDQLPFDAFDPRNPVSLMATPFAGTFMPSSGRCEVQGLGPMLYPIEWFAHSNFGGRFTAQLKFAGWDGVVVEGAADEPVWINIINDKVTIESAKGIWGMDTWDTQEEVVRRVNPNLRRGEWTQVGDSYTTQVPAVVCIGQAGENKSRMAALLHGPGSQASNCGFGGVFGSKKLKAISVIGTGSVPIADPKALMAARQWFKKFQWNVDDPFDKKMEPRGFGLINGAPSGGNVTNGTLPLTPARAAACASCPRGCRMRLSTSESNESVCAGTMAVRVQNGTNKLTRQGNDLMQKYGLSHWQFMTAQGYLNALYKKGVLGKGKTIDCDLPMDQVGTLAFADLLMKRIATRQGVGAVLTEGISRAAEKWGRLKEDSADGSMGVAYWGTSEHYDPRVEAEWGFGGLMGERDLMLHNIANYPLHWMPSSSIQAGIDPYMTAEQAAKVTAESMIPYQGDEFMLDYSDGPTGIYSDHKVKQVAWVKHYEKFWIGSNGFCGWRWPMAFTNNTADHKGPTPDAEPRFFNAITGKNLTFADGMEIGRKIYALDRSIWVLQGRHRDMEVFPDYIYTTPSRGTLLPMHENGKWSYADGKGRILDRAKVEEWKTKFYEFQGYNSANGWPKRSTLEALGLKKVADNLQSKSKLG